MHRYWSIVKRLYFRSDAAFANSEMYEFLEAEGIGYTIWLPANSVLQRRIWHLLKRPVGRPPHEVRCYLVSFTYRAQSWSKPRRVVTKVEWHPGELYPRVGFIVTNLARPAERVVTFYNQRRHGRAVDLRGQERNQMDTAVMPNLGRQCSSSPVARARLQPRKLHADASDAQRGGAMVTDEPAGEADQDWRKGRQPWPLRDVPDGRVAVSWLMFRDILMLIARLRAPPHQRERCRDRMRQTTTAEVRHDEGKATSFRRREAGTHRFRCLRRLGLFTTET